MRQLNRQSEIENQKCDCQGGDSNSRPRAYESPALPLSYPGEFWRRQRSIAGISLSTHDHTNDSSSSSTSSAHSQFSDRRAEKSQTKRKRKTRPLLLWLREIRRQIFLITSQRGHKAYSAAFRYCTHPAFLTNIAPSGKVQHRASFRIALRRKEK